MATNIEKISKDVYKVNDKEITLTGRVIPNNLKQFLTTEEIINLNDLIKSEDKVDINN